jgi:hypothetical protein
MALLVAFFLSVPLLVAFLAVVFFVYSRTLAVVGLIILIPSMMSLTALGLVLRHFDYIVRVGDWALVDKVLQPGLKATFITMSGIALAFVNQTLGTNAVVEGPTTFQVLVAIATITVVSATVNAFDAVYAAVVIGRDRKAEQRRNRRTPTRRSRQFRRTGR